MQPHTPQKHLKYDSSYTPHQILQVEFNSFAVMIGDWREIWHTYDTDTDKYEDHPSLTCNYLKLSIAVFYGDSGNLGSYLEFMTS